jgi:predicted AlkP superfamily pyrophosphatase or phosphodiesterase
MRCVGNCATSALAAALLVSSSALTQGQRENARPKLVVVLVVDQMRADYVDKFGHQWTHGLRRLVDHGAWFRQAAYPYWGTHTCVGHATISTGSVPATHGIPSNTWWDRGAGKVVTCTEDPQAQVISYGAAVAGGESAARLDVPTFPDELRAQGGGKSLVVTFSLKARAAIMLAGHRADVVTWHDEKTGAWLTSTAYASAPVSFVAQYVKTHPVENDFRKPWTLSRPEATYLREASTTGERPPPGWTTAFPHVLKGNSEEPDEIFYQLWEKSPFADAYLARMAESAVETLQLGKGPGTDFLGVSFSTLDLIGHAYGPSSLEIQDELARLDGTIGRFLAYLDGAVGPLNYVVAFTADHGVAPIPEQAAARGFDAGRLPTAEVMEKAQGALEKSLGRGKYVVGMVDNNIYLAPGVNAKLAANRAAIEGLTAAILGVPGVGRVLASDELAERRASDDALLLAAARGHVPGRSGDILVLEKPYWLLGGAARDPSATLGTDHGTAYGYDTHVPLIFLGRGVRPGEYLAAATPADIAPTLAFLCGITLARSDGRVLTEALAIPAAPPPKAEPARR